MHPTRRELIAGASALGLVATLQGRGLAAIGAGPATGDAAATALLSDIAEELLADFPELALKSGIDKGKRSAFHPRFGDRSHAADRARAGRAGKRLAQLRAIDRRPLSADVALDLDTTEAAFALAEEGWRTMKVGDVAVLNTNNSFRNTPYVVSQLAGAYSDLPDLLENKQDVADAADADAYLARIESYAAAVDAETGRTIADGAAGTILPGFLIDITAGQLKAMVAEPVANCGIIKTFAAKCARAGLPKKYADRAAELSTSKVVPALQRQVAAFDALRPRASETPGLWERPGGDASYAWLVKAGTTPDRTPEQLHQLGIDQDRALNAQIDTLLKAQGLNP